MIQRLRGNSSPRVNDVKFRDIAPGQNDISFHRLITQRWRTLMFPPNKYINPIFLKLAVFILKTHYIIRLDELVVRLVMRL